MKRNRLFTSAVAALAVAAIAGGVAYATIPGPGNVYSACMLKGLGTIRLIDKSLPSTSLMSRCTDKETEISWNQAGQLGPAGPQGAKGEPGAPGTNGTNGTNGADGEAGVSITSAAEPAGSNCADGGVELTAVNGVSYVCNGGRGPQGDQGPAGPAGGATPMLVAIQIPEIACPVFPACLSPNTLFDLPGVGRVEVACRPTVFGNQPHVEPTLMWRFANTTSADRTVFAAPAGFSRLGPGASTEWSGSAAQADLFEVAIFRGDATLGVSPSAQLRIYSVETPDHTKCDVWGVARPS